MIGDTSEASSSKIPGSQIASETSGVSDEAFAPLELMIAQAAPIARIGFKEELQMRLTTLSKAAPRANYSHSSPSLFRRWRFVAVTAAVFLIGLSALYAITTLVRQAIQNDGGLSVEEGQPIDLQQTLDGYTLTAEWVYADSNRISVGLNAAFDPAEESVNAISPETVVQLTDANGLEYPFLTMTGSAVEQNTAGVIYSFAVPEGVPPGAELAFHLTVDLRIFYSTLQTFHVGLFQYDFRTILRDESKSFNLPQTVTVSGIPVTITKVEVSPSLTRIETCFTVQDDTFSDWIPVLYLRVGSRNLNDGAIRIDGSPGTSAECGYTNFYVDLSSEEGTWEIEIRELIGTRMLVFEQMPTQPIPLEEGQRRIPGPWQFILEGE